MEIAELLKGFKMINKWICSSLNFSHSKLAELSRPKRILLGLLTIAWVPFAIAKAYPPMNFLKDPPIIPNDRQSQMASAIAKSYDIKIFRKADTMPGAWFGNPKQPFCIGWGIYEHESNFSTIPWKENYYHLCDPPGWDRTNPGTPLLIDLGRNGFRLGKRGVGVQFDINSIGTSETFQWVAQGTDDAFLVRDVNQNGRIDDGSELFGSGTFIGPYDQRATNGYLGLSQFDSVSAFGGNQDGVISAEDEVWDSLLLWIDSNADAITDPGELRALDEFGIRIIDTNYRETRNRQDRAGNQIPYWSFIYLDRDQRPRRMLMADIIFRRLESR